MKYSEIDIILLKVSVCLSYYAVILEPLRSPSQVYLC